MRLLKLGGSTVIREHQEPIYEDGLSLLFLFFKQPDEKHPHESTVDCQPEPAASQEFCVDGPDRKTAV